MIRPQMRRQIKKRRFRIEGGELGKAIMKMGTRGESTKEILEETSSGDGGRIN